MEWYLKVLNQYADFQGRARRKEYWMFFLFNMLISYGIILLSVAINIPELVFLSSLYSLAVIVPSIAVGVRRMHDVGKSGWFLLIPFYNLILACTDSEYGRNKWGENPKGIGNDNDINRIGRE